MQLSEKIFRQYRNWFLNETGIDLPSSKTSLVVQRLAQRLRERRQDSLDRYFDLLMEPDEQQERLIALDLLTTHETYFFREPQHFEWLKQKLSQVPKPKNYRVWSAASSTGEEVWSLAMLLMDRLGNHLPWQILASDVSAISLERARNGHYSMQRTDGISRQFLQRYCLRGTGKQQGTLLINRILHPHVEFQPINLTQPLPNIGMFDLVFLRNVLIYFDAETKNKIVKQVARHITKGGHLVVGHSESLLGMPTELQIEAPGIYRLAS